MRLFENELTEREEEVLMFIADGKTNKQIAAALDISVWTAQDHVRSIRQKLHVPTRTAAAQVYLQRRYQTNLEISPNSRDRKN